MKNQIELRNKVTQLRKSKTNLPSICGVLSTFFFIGLALWVLKTYWSWWTGVAVFFTIGFMQYRLVLASHEAVHKNLFYPVWLNELVGLICASFVGISLFNYRKAHLEHHKAPQSIQDDIDGYIYRPLLKAKPGWNRLCLLITGNYVDILTKLRRKFLGDGNLEGTHAEVGKELPSSKQIFLQLFPIVIIQGTTLAFFIWYLNGWSYLIWWLTPIFVVALQMDRARTFLEHGYNYFFPGPPIENLAEAQQDTIDIDTNAIERYLFAPYGFSYHQGHHSQLTVPFYRLKELTQLLEEYQPNYHRRVRGSYLTILFKMLWAYK
ncbi:MAG: fatty acid desaturase [Verrucomicrobiae bacterium]|nr:fatty acid desaturase [Verrucomicrobiae bacterium]